jgi:hypothetical protein
MSLKLLIFIEVSGKCFNKAKKLLDLMKRKYCHLAFISRMMLFHCLTDWIEQSFPTLSRHVGHVAGFRGVII